MALHKLCLLADLPAGEARVFEIEDFRLAAARTGDTVYALEDRCSHDDGELGQGRVLPSNGTAEIECPRHGARFDLATGRATRMPAVAPIEVFPAKIEGGHVWVELPEY